jgi:hypothetical protein
VKKRWRREGRVKLFCNLKLLTLPAYISRALFVYVANK